MREITLGTIGYGRIGVLHAQWVTQARGIHVAAVADPTDARRELARGHGWAVYASAREMLADADIDAVLVTTPTSMHFEHAMLAMGRGRHVMVDKPMALDLAQARQMAQEARRRGVVLSVFQNRRWDPDYLALRSAISAGLLGRIFNIESRLGQWASCVGPAAVEYRPNWRNEAAFGGGGLYDWGSHFLDQLWRLMLPARPVRLFAQLRGNVWTEDCDDLARICIDFDDGSAGLVEINTTTTRPLPRWHIDGTAGSADSPYSLEYDTRIWSQFQFTPAAGGPPQPLPPTAEPPLSVIQIWERFAAAIRGEGEPAVTAASVLPTMALMDAARESARHGQSIHLPDEMQWE